MVVEQTAAEFFEARVLAVDKATLRVQRLDQGDATSVARSDVHPLPAPKRAWSSGELAVCSPAPARWVACKIESAALTRIVARDAQGSELILDPTRLVAPTPVTQLNLERRFARARERAHFVEAVERAGAPRPPGTWRPSNKERVVAQHEGVWYSARIDKLDDDGLFVEWIADGRISRVETWQVVPEPPWARLPERNTLALLRPGADTYAWQPVRVLSSGPEYLTENASGERKTVARSDLVPLGATSP